MDNQYDVSQMEKKFFPISPPTEEIVSPVDKQKQFQTDVKQVQDDLNRLKEEVRDAASKANASSNQDLDQITDQVTTNNQLLDEAGDISDKINNLKNGASDANKELLAQLSTMLEGLYSALSVMTAQAGEALAGYILLNTPSSPTAQQQVNNPNNPAIPTPTNPGAGSDPSDPPAPNLFLMTGMLTILFDVQLQVIKQMLANKDAERQVKQAGYEEVHAFANMSAQAAYNKDIDQANMQMAQAITSFIGGALSLGVGLASMNRTGSMRKEVEYEKNMLESNPEYEKQIVDQGKLDPKDFKDQPINHSLKADPTDPTSKTVTPGYKQMEARVNRIDEQLATPEGLEKGYNKNCSDVVKKGGTVTLSEDEYRAGLVKEKAELEPRMQDAKRNYDRFSVGTQFSERVSYDGKMMMLQQLGNLSKAWTEAAGAAAQAALYTKMAADEKMQILAQSAMDVANKYLQSAMDAFGGEEKNIQSVVEAMISASSKNTQWASIRA